MKNQNNSQFWLSREVSVCLTPLMVSTLPFPNHKANDPSNHAQLKQQEFDEIFQFCALRAPYVGSRRLHAIYAVSSTNWWLFAYSARPLEIKRIEIQRKSDTSLRSACCTRTVEKLYSALTWERGYAALHLRTETPGIRCIKDLVHPTAGVTAALHSGCHVHRGNTPSPLPTRKTQPS